MRKFRMQQRGERRISAALRIALAVLALLLQIFLVILFSRILEEHAAIVYAVLQIAALIVAVSVINRRGSTIYKLPWIILLLALPVVGFILYSLWSGETQRKRLMQQAKRSPEEPESSRMRSRMCEEKLGRALPNWLRTVKSLSRRNFYLYQNTEITYYPEGDELFADILSEIERAEHFIFLEYFIIAEGEIWDRLSEVLCRKARAGVEVKIIFDDFGSIKRFHGETIDVLRENGVEVYTFNPVHEYVNRLYFNYRDHRKIACIDGKSAYTGGINIADEYANLVNRFGHWKDSGVRLEGEGVWGITATFCDMCAMLGAEMHNERDYYRPHVGVKSEGFCQPICDSPLNNPDNPAEDVYLQLIGGAQRFLYITSPYFAPDENLLRALCIAGDGGVDVRLMLPGTPDHWYTDFVAESYFGELMEHGVKVYRYTPGFLHSKSVMVDREVAFIGSVNTDYRSFEMNFECGVMLYGVSAVEDLLEDMDRIMEASRMVTIDEWNKRSAWRKMSAPLLRLFSIWM